MSNGWNARSFDDPELSAASWEQIPVTLVDGAKHEYLRVAESPPAPGARGHWRGRTSGRVIQRLAGRRGALPYQAPGLYQASGFSATLCVRSQRLTLEGNHALPVPPCYGGTHI